jgi:hypothetical protein
MLRLHTCYTEDTGIFDTLYFLHTVEKVIIQLTCRTFRTDVNVKVC